MLLECSGGREAKHEVNGNRFQYNHTISRSFISFTMNSGVSVGLKSMQLLGRWARSSAPRFQLRPSVMMSSAASSSAPIPEASTTSTLGIVETEVQTATGTVPVTTELHIVDTQKNDKIPAFRLLDIAGKPIPNAVLPEINKEVSLNLCSCYERIYHTMCLSVLRLLACLLAC